VPGEDHETLARCFARTQQYDPASPSLRVCHPNDMAHRVGYGLGAGLPVFELNRFTPAEKHHLGQPDLVCALSRWALAVLQEQGIDNVELAPFGVYSCNRRSSVAHGRQRRRRHSPPR